MVVFQAINSTGKINAHMEDVVQLLQYLKDLEEEEEGEIPVLVEGEAKTVNIDEFVETIQENVGGKEAEYLEQLIRYEQDEIETISIEQLRSIISHDIENQFNKQRKAVRKWRIISLLLAIISVILGMMNGI